ncbi:hypothetical protein FO440_22625 [Mucilaginibacter corticis]|uniref:Uncharacterized protein n=1 Tax=Mucilaginibacter corticis TaxID=2597670 RepID=A0A556M9Y7_9SPHI|nr:hypothetical protein [Mucilaginibacter corticis]TSJ36625.1 hypothetical protein FO440_22625 [Mucilaginibacter corticis]
MGKQHDTIPNEPQEAPVQSPKPEIQQPNDPQGPTFPQEAPGNQPQEIPQQPDQGGSGLNQTEV